MNRTILIMLMAGLVFGTCKKSEKKDDTPLLALAYLMNSSTCSTASSSTSTGTTVSNNTATLNTSTGCVTGVTSCMDSALPSWIKDNFKCATGYVSGGNYVFKSQNVPNTKSSYYGTSSPLYEARTTTGPNPNTTSSQKLVYTIPSSPTRGTGTVSTQGGLASIGITVNGLAIFNNAAAPPDLLTVEALTFDNYGGHPQNSGIYHHHAGATKITNNDANLVGLILDGYAIYGKKCDNGTATTADDFTPGDLDSLHGHTTKTIHFATATYHYHLAFDATATIDTLMGSFFYGNTGSVSN
ncbi:YHYH protein [Leptospira sp. 'Mane']|uniref:YHYH protein n=1 Tax=Leptospira sp. 'Mane' TaxID=3387407 RepID=UPI00398B2B58